MNMPNRVNHLYALARDFIKKCSDDHVTAFGSMSAFFILLSFFPFLIFFLTLTRYAPFTKDDIISVLTQMIAFEQESLITSIVNEIYGKTAASIFTTSIITVLWSSSKGMYSIAVGLNSVYDIEESRNYIVMRLVSILFTIAFAFIIIIMLLLWIFGNALYNFIYEYFPIIADILRYFLHQRTIYTLIILTLLFMIIYQFVPNRKSPRFLQQLPGALITTIGWLVVSAGCSFYMNHFSNFSYIYGGLSGIMILLLWLYLCMSMVFYGAEVNYFLENRDNYHTLVHILRPNYRNLRRQKEREIQEGSMGSYSQQNKIRFKINQKEKETRRNSQKKPGEGEKDVSNQQTTDS